MTDHDYSHIVFESDLLRERLRMRAGAIELIRQMVAIRRDDWHFYMTKRPLLDDPRLTDQERVELSAGFRELEIKLDKIRVDISNTIQLVRDLDNDSYAGMESLPEH
jgi:hypothetical protein